MLIKNTKISKFDKWLNNRVKFITDKKVLYQGEEKTIEEMFEIYKFVKSNN